jgi:hypothetical protein
MDKTDSGVDYVNFWLRRNGADVTASSGVVSLQGNSPAYMMAAWNYLIELIENDVIELYWGSTDVGMSILSETAQTSPFAHPAVQSTILTITQQSGILAGTGITGLGTAGNIQTGATQTLATGTTGTDFAIVSSGNTQTFNIPTASASNRGLLSTSDFTTFTNKLSNSLTNQYIFVGNGTNVATGVAMSGDTTITNAGAVSLDANYKAGSAGVTFDGGGAVITNNKIAYVRVPYKGTITAWYIATDVAGACSILVEKGSFPPPTTIFTAVLPSGRTANGTGLSISVAAGDYLAFTISGVSTVTWVNLSIQITKIL